MSGAGLPRHRLARRGFLRALAGALGALVAACAPRGTLESLTPTAAPSHVSTATRPVVAGDWSGRVLDSGGMPIGRARVTLLSADRGFFREARTDPSGAYAFPDAPAGNLTLGACAPGYEYQEAAGISGGLEFALGPETQPGRWSVIEDTEPEAFGGTNSGVLMPDGRIIYCHDTVRPIVFDPASGQKAFPNASPSVQGCHMPTYLPDGRILYVGGTVDHGRNFDNQAVRTVKAFDPELTWEVFPDLTAKRWYPGLARLADGRCLIFGGGAQPEQIRVASCEIFDPATRAFTPTGSLTTPGGFGPAILLLTGEVLLTWWPPQIYNPATGVWRNAGMFRQPNRSSASASRPLAGDHPDHTALLLEDGRVAAIGVRRTAGETMVENFDPASGAWSLGTSPPVLRSMCEVLMLPSGKILVAGGKRESETHDVYVNAFGQTRLTELYDPMAGTWRALAEMKWAREYHAITLLAPDGRVITTAGTGAPGVHPGPEASRDIEAYEPPYFFRGPRPVIDSLSTRTLERGGTFSVGVSRTAAPTQVILIGMNAITHWMDGGVPRRLSLPFTQSAGSLDVSVPEQEAVAMPGFYLLFILVDDIPSDGVIVQVL